MREKETPFYKLSEEGRINRLYGESNHIASQNRIYSHLNDEFLDAAIEEAERTRELGYQLPIRVYCGL